ncbi:hypothetical protein SAMN05421856_101374 [Chryseobacterium taichungense]|uniref:Uncharacterized protein n=1 Tax=Chryseobacterium taichungense TaxID=295069 RepID=A0A1H7W095_9FLAO|nr:hypothetical protein [Chryseobacterium taichungense]SEM14495.1 hypothetical protein SAMN05421856_101374 [Chryseobacterium taichungense]
MKNVIQTQLTPDLKTQIDTKIAELEALFQGKLVALDADQRKFYGLINEQNKLFVNKVRDYKANQPQLSAGDVNWDEFENDYQARVFLETRKEKLASLVYQMESTKILHDYDNYNDALDDYAYSQYKKGREVIGFAEKVAELKQFFPRTPKSSTSEDKNKAD